MARNIRLTRGHVAIVDDDDYEMLCQLRWRFFDSGNGYAGRQYRMPDTKKRVYVSMHQTILNVSGVEVDHINRDGLDNRRCNLRIASHRANTCNRAGWGRSGFKGVMPVGSKWGAYITANCKYHWLGTYDKKEDAARAYNEAAKMFNGEYAFMNKV